MLLDIVNSGLDDVWSNADLIVAASGYEPRCTHAIERIHRQWGCSHEELGRKLVLLQFDSLRELESRRAADRFFASYKPFAPLPVGTDEGVMVREKLSHLLGERGCGKARVVIDYSAMSRMLYLCLLDLLKEGHELQFVYSVGAYGVGGPDFPVAAVGEIRNVPGLQGVPMAQCPRVHVFGLGYDGVGTRALVEKLEAQRIVVFWADPGAVPDSAAVAKNQNAAIIQRADATFSTDLRNVEGASAALQRISFELRPHYKMVLVPVGPKPQVLACGLVAVQNDHVTLLAPHVEGGGIRDRFPIVAAAGELVITTVTRRENSASEGAARQG